MGITMDSTSFKYPTNYTAQPHYQYTITLPLEREFDIGRQLLWFQNNVRLSFYIVGLYCLIIYLLKVYMKDRPRLELRPVVFLWNVGLALFSLMVVLRILPDIVFDWNEYGFEYTICDASPLPHNPVLGFWVSFFALSKFIEFGDTVFLVFRKRPLTFLHMYHHISVALGAFYFIQKELGPVRWVPLVNGGVHTIMYTYFALKVMRIKIPLIVSMLLTSIQLFQMFYFVYLIVRVNIIKSQGRECALLLDESLTLGTAVVSYGLLFMNYFYQAYLKKPTTSKQKKVQ